MANPPISQIPVSETDLLNPNPLTEFDSIEFPPVDTDFLNGDPGFMDDLDFDFTFDDFAFPPDGSDVLSSNIIDHNSGDWFMNDADDANGVTKVLNSPSPESRNPDSRVLEPALSHQSGEDQDHLDRKVDRCLNDVSRVLNSPSPDSSGNSDQRVSAPVSSQDSGDSGDSGGCASIVNGFLNSPDSPESGVISGSTPSPPRIASNVVVVDVVCEDVKVEEEGKGCVLKRKKEKEDDNPNSSSSNSNPRSSKFRKGTTTTTTPLDNVPPEEDKKKARLMRNRESAQLSRQRKKHYVEELEDKVRSMHTVIADLNNRISYIMAENASLRQQLTGGNVPPQPGVYPPPTMAPMPYPWVPCAPYPIKPQGSQLPLVPIPRLKPKQTTSSVKLKKSESKKNESKTKKVSSVTFLGLLFFVFLFWGLVPLVNVRYGGSLDGSTGFGYNFDGFNGHYRGRVLTVDNHLNGSHQKGDVGVHSGKSNLRECGANKIHCRRAWVEGVESKTKQGKQGSQPLADSNGLENGGNSSEPLVASLYVPRNDKLVKIDGNLIIHSVLASEKAMASRATPEVKRERATAPTNNESPHTSLAIAGNLAAAFSVPNTGRHIDRHPNMYRSPSVQQKALDSGSRDNYKESPRSTATDGSLQKWFHEGLAGPILSSGICSEVFQFDISSAANPGGIVPATPAVNVSAKNESDSVHMSKKNRRILNHLPAALAGSLFNDSNEHGRIPSEEDSEYHKNKSMVVSVLVDPREAGDIEVGSITPKSLSKIFVVVLIDSVKYVTYSCRLPFKGSHLVTA